MFTTQHYVMLAGLIDQVRSESAGDDLWLTVFAGRLTDELARDNPRFNRARFLKACGMEELS